VIPLFPLPAQPPNTPEPQRNASPDSKRSRPCPATPSPRALSREGEPYLGGGEAGRKPLAKGSGGESRPLWLGFVLGQHDQTGGNDVCPGQRVLISEDLP